MTLGVLMRFEAYTRTTIMKPQTYNPYSLNGVNDFPFIIPGIPAVFGNFFLPIQIGAKDVIFPRINLLSWYLYIWRTLVVSLFTY
jgi:cytochrome c oxidase subunit 1